MCGLNAIFAYGADAPPVSRDELVHVRDTMEARGPDGAGLYISADGRAGLGHRRLAIIDPSPAGAQPMASPDGRLHIAFNGEIYNYRALKAELEAGGARFVSDSDTEVLLHLYARDGVDMVRALRGMYAFALWDEGARGLLLARDPYGIKPLYYADSGHSFRAASQVKALLAGGGIDDAPSPAGHAGFYLLGYVPDPHTMFAAIKALPAGHTLWVDGAGAGGPQPFFDLRQRLAEAGSETVGPVNEALLGDALRESVRHHLIADVPVGLFLSAGRDSATLAALASEQASALRSVTLGFDEFAGTAADEVPLAETVARHVGTRHQTRRVARTDFADSRAGLWAAMDQPTIDGVNSYFVARETRKAGLKVALSGLGGDEMFGGYPSFHQVPALVRALGPLAHLPGLGAALRRLAAPWIGAVTSPKYAGLVEYGGSIGDAYLLRRALYMPWELPRLMDPAMARDGLAALAPRPGLAASMAGIATPHARLIALESLWYMRNQLLRDADWAGMAHGLEIRVPLVDAALFARLAPALAGPSPPDKGAMAATPATPLPDAVLRRPKTGFSVPVRDWLAAETDDETPDRPGAAPARGLRGWAHTVIAAYLESAAAIRASSPFRGAP